MGEAKPGDPKPATLLRADEIATDSDSYHHPWNPSSEIQGCPLSRRAGLERIGVSLARVPPGKESFAYHSHHCEEEWIYILRGRGVAIVDGVRHEVGPGDFLGFPTPSVAHHMINPHEEPLEYLMGGENREIEIADFPDLNRRMLRRGPKIEIYPLDAGEPFRRSSPAGSDGDT